MNKAKIQTYSDLLNEERRLDALNDKYKEELMMHWETTSEKFGGISKLLFPEKYSQKVLLGKSLLAYFADTMLNLWLKKTVFRKTNWIVILGGSLLLRKAVQTFLSKQKK